MSPRRILPLALVGLLLFCGAAPATAQIVPGVHATAGSANDNDVTTAAIDTSGANLIICALNSVSNGNAVTDSKSNSYTGLTEHGTANRLTIFYVLAPTVGSGHTFTSSPGGSTFPALACRAYSGVKTSLPVDVQNGVGDTSSTSLQTGSVSPSEGCELIVTGLGIGGSTATGHSINSGFSIVDTTLGDGLHHYGVSLADLVQTSAAAVNPTWSWTNSELAVAGIATFKAASCVTGPPIGTRSMMGNGR